MNVTKRTLSDVDGRTGTHILGTPGGEAGEFILALQVYEEMLGKELKQGSGEKHDVKKYLEDYLKATRPRKFAMHTSMAAVESLQQDLVTGDLDIRNPPETTRDALLGKVCNVHPCGLMSPANVGMSHLQYMLSYPSMYNVQKSLVQEFIREFYTMLWNEDSPYGQQLEFSVLHKVQQEKAFVSIEVSPGCRTESKVPMVVPFKKTVQGDQSRVTSVFVAHPDAAAIRRKELAAFFSKLDPKHHIQAKDMESRLNLKGAQALRETAKNLAQGLPVFRVLVI